MASSSLVSLPCLSSLKMTFKPMAVNSNSSRTSVPYELKKGQNRLFHKLPSGLKMEVIEQRKDEDERQRNSEKDNPPLVFVHGSYHAAWCWAEHWLPFFSSSGFDSYAISLLGQGESDEPLGTVAGTLQTHASDIVDFIESNLSSSPPVLIGHSFGGLVVQYYLANVINKQSLGTTNAFPELSGAVLVCSVPPSGNSGLVLRYLFSKPVAAFKVTLSLAAKRFQTSIPLCRETFFSSAMDDQLVKRYQDLMRESSRMPLFDLRKLNASLPVSKPMENSTKVLVLGAKDDFIVDDEGLKETGRFYDVEPVCIEGVAHDMMLDCSWEKGAEALLYWLCGLSKTGKFICLID
ncbi:hypothetical protein EUTSA_v10027821mg [Eutrema salsugineum]|uniref:AB hydrolase-1 domain-containing protein n=1 Tax=Eutrema salsugineum TaxID=72664 RepID=V4LXF5_EUTSA|nr:uncharacterized protein LOC18022837 [Eutrema salsugineum]ESQ47227.1 hypothetical protein EUTSA_v10027821mg [Eutrema salsugineum]